MDSDSSDGTRAICSDWVSRDPVRFRYYDLRDRFQSAKFNFGVRNARGQRIYLLGSDNYLSARVLEECADIARDGFEAVGVPVQDLLPNGYLARCILFSVVSVNQTHYPNFVRKDVWERLGGMDSRVPYVEDVDFYKRFVNLGYRLKNISSKSLHDQRMSLRSVIQKSKYYVVGMNIICKSAGERREFQQRTYLASTIGGVFETMISRPIYIPGIVAVLSIRIATRLITRIGLALHMIRS